MIEREFIKVVFINNPFNLQIDVFSLPIISTILTSIDNPNQEFIRYERGSDFPNNLRNNYKRFGYQYELFEFGYQRTDSRWTSTIDNNNNSNGYEWNKCTSCDNGQLDKYKKEIAWCVFKNSRRLNKIGSNSTRYCYVNTKKNIHIVTTSPCAIAKFEETCLDIESTTEKTDVNNILGYMKVFSTSAKNSYISSLNYRNSFNLFNHIMLYFDIKKYYQMNSAQIFSIPFNMQINIINSAMSSNESEYEDDDDVKFNKKEDDKFENVQILLYDEVLSSSESACCEMLPLTQTYPDTNFNCTSFNKTTNLLCSETMST